MCLAAPDGTVRNDHLRRRTAGDKPRVRYLAGELWRAFATIRHWHEIESGVRQHFRETFRYRLRNLRRCQATLERIRGD